MKNFREFVSENYNVPVVDIQTTGTDVSIPEIKNELNRNLALVLTRKFQTVEEGLAKLRKILSLYSLDLPDFDANDMENDTIIFPVGHKHFSYDEIKGKIDNKLDDYKLKFSYSLENGLYKCTAELQ